MSASSSSAGHALARSWVAGRYSNFQEPSVHAFDLMAVDRYAGDGVGSRRTIPGTLRRPAAEGRRGERQRRPSRPCSCRGPAALAAARTRVRTKAGSSPAAGWAAGRFVGRRVGPGVARTPDKRPRSDAALDDRVPLTRLHGGLSTVRQQIVRRATDHARRASAKGPGADLVDSPRRRSASVSPLGPATGLSTVRRHPAGLAGLAEASTGPRRCGPRGRSGGWDPSAADKRRRVRPRSMLRRSSGRRFVG